MLLTLRLTVPVLLDHTCAILMTMRLVVTGMITHAIDITIDCYRDEVWGVLKDAAKVVSDGHGSANRGRPLCALQGPHHHHVTHM